MITQKKNVQTEVANRVDKIVATLTRPKNKASKCLSKNNYRFSKKTKKKLYISLSI